jgi:hypothetical protein
MPSIAISALLYYHLMLCQFKYIGHRRYNTQHNNAQHNNAQHDMTQHLVLLNATGFFNEVDTLESSSILIYSESESSLYTQ